MEQLNFDDLILDVDHQRANRIIFMISVNISKYRDLYHLMLPLQLGMARVWGKIVFEIARCASNKRYIVGHYLIDMQLIGAECGIVWQKRHLAEWYFCSTAEIHHWGLNRIGLNTHRDWFFYIPEKWKKSTTRKEFRSHIQSKDCCTQFEIPVHIAMESHKNSIYSTNSW